MYVCQYGWGVCANCDWSQVKSALKEPDKIWHGNLVAFNRARQLYEEGKQLIPTIEEFGESLYLTAHME